MTEHIAAKQPHEHRRLGRPATVPDVIAGRAAKVPLRVPVRFEATSLDGIRKQLRVTPGIKGHRVFELVSDEGTSIPPGKDSAPAPLDHFAVGAALCPGSSHLTLVIDRNGLDVRGFTMQGEVWFHYSPEVRGMCLGLRTLVDLDSDEPAGALTELVAQAKGMCLAEAAPAEPVPIQTAVSVGGRLLDADAGSAPGSPPPPDDADGLLQ